MKVRNNYINGQWIGSEEQIANYNPSDPDDLVGCYAAASRQDVIHALQSAHDAREAWKNVTVQQRHDILDRIGTEILRRKDELGYLLSREEGKTLAEGLGEVVRAGMIFKFFAGEALRCTGDVLPSVRPGVDIEVIREPVGVVGVVTPWNFPIAIPAWKIAPALAFGNCVVFKPASLTPGSAWALSEIIAGAGVPVGVYNMVMGSGSVVGKALTDSRYVDALTFTGSNAVGRNLAGTAVPQGIKLQLEMGGKNPLVVLDDADIDTAVHCAIQGGFYSTGQRCTASSRLIVTAEIHDQFVAKMIDETRKLNVGDALAPDTQIGPVVDETQLKQNLEYIKIGQGEGAHLACGGELLSREKKGFYFSPAIFTQTNNAMRINREEIFGPIVSVIRVQGFEEALSVANDTEFGLTAGIVTSSLKYSSEFKKRSEAGVVMVNLPTAGVDYHVPFGGRKGSSYGPKEQGAYAREFFTVTKTAYIAPH